MKIQVVEDGLGVDDGSTVGQLISSRCKLDQPIDDPVAQRAYRKAIYGKDDSAIVQVKGHGKIAGYLSQALDSLFLDELLPGMRYILTAIWQARCTGEVCQWD